jgi:uroporphyrinogen-III decarboxylase
MTPREILFAALEGRPTERVPVWLLFPYHATSYYVDVRHHPAYRPVHEMALRHAVTLNRRNLSAPIFTPDVKRTVRRRRVEGVAVEETTWECGALRLTERRSVPHGPAGNKRLLTTAEELETFAAMPIETDARAISAALDAQLGGYLREREEFPRECGAMMLDLGEPIGALYHASKMEELCVWSATHNDVVAGILDRLMERSRAIYRYCLERELAEVYFMVGSELAAPPMVSRETFRRWVLPYARELIARVHEGGGRVIQHFHGEIRHLLPEFVEMGPDGLHTIEAPPVGNCTMAQAYEAVGEGITLIGNIQYDDFRALTPEQMTRAVHELLDECRGRRLILSPSAGPFDPDPPPRLIENYRAFLNAAATYRRG